MKRTEIINSIATKSGLTKTDAAKFLKAFLETLVDGLRKDGKVVLVGHLSLEKTFRKATMASNPKTRMPVHVPAKVGVKIRAGKLFVDAVSSKK